MYNVKVEANCNDKKATIDIPPDSDGTLMIKFSNGKVTESSVFTSLVEKQPVVRDDTINESEFNKKLKPSLESVLSSVNLADASTLGYVEELRKEKKISEETTILEDLSKIQAGLAGEKCEAETEDILFKSAGFPLFYLQSEGNKHYFTDGKRCYFIDPDKLMRWHNGEEVEWYDEK